ncbi:uncharacterized protein BO80DRAFT_420377 [Aspergillus ibericus CBS 121593]|uniref:Uncharacterized protein n=1 Tax=Aspergillus ibericus CBS 121593 TaxID=1448316 RepID=A0A395HDW6_9EURO|nr:hypothetical protein BO80DRAFT_420377 [Aspergillus ibericus CBS 121593]RAL06067.1 hypothetical protein BO80DRAFT_420377 [Aspergillus ibericus CBS 121593]
MPYLYYCCQCGDGPKLWENQPWCILCRHRACSGCKPADKSTPAHKGASPTVDTTISGDSGNFPAYAPESCAAFHDIRESMSDVFIHSTPIDCRLLLEWDLRRFVKVELNGCWNLGALLTLSGTVDNAYATTCEQYIQLFWGEDGLAVLQAVKNHVMNNDLPLPQFEHLGVRYTFEADDCGRYIDVQGTPRNLSIFFQLLSWLVCTFQVSQRGPLKAYRGVMRKPDSVGSRTYYSIEREPRTIADHERGSCWLPLYQNSNLAHGYPVPPRTGGIGLELSFDVLLTLGRIHYPLELPDGIILKGHSTMLIPTLISSPNCLQWHFIVSETPERYIEVDRIPDGLKENMIELDVDTLKTYRAFVGYCTRARVHMGTKHSQFDQICSSEARNARTTVRLEREIAPTISLSGLGSFGAGIGSRVIFPRGLIASVENEEILLEDRLLNSQRNPLLLYDVPNQTGFLVPELCAVLEIAHVWAARQADRDTLLSVMPFAEVSHDGGQAAYNAIVENRNLVLREAQADEKPYMFLTKLKEIFRFLEQRRELQRAYNSSIRMLESHSIRGWELYDIAACRSSWEKQVRLPLGKASCWRDIVHENQDTIVLFCQGMADAIQPEPGSVCGAWIPLPRRENFLLASTSCIRDLTDIHGGNQHRPKLGNQLFVDKFRETDPFGPCDAGSGGTCNRVLKLTKSRPGDEFVLPKEGAIVLGSQDYRPHPGRTTRSGPLEISDRLFSLFIK